MDVSHSVVWNFVSNQWDEENVLFWGEEDSTALLDRSPIPCRGLSFSLRSTRYTSASNSNKVWTIWPYVYVYIDM